MRVDVGYVRRQALVVLLLRGDAQRQERGRQAAARARALQQHRYSMRRTRKLTNSCTRYYSNIIIVLQGCTIRDFLCRAYSPFNSQVLRPRLAQDLGALMS